MADHTRGPVCTDGPDDTTIDMVLMSAATPLVACDVCACDVAGAFRLGYTPMRRCFYCGSIRPQGVTHP